MATNFREDLAKAKGAEEIVLNTFSSLCDSYSFQDVSNDREYYYKGDIKATSADGREIYIEVKDDSRIADTQRVLCEEEVYYYDSDYTAKGNMYNACNIYCVVSKQDRQIYVFDFEILKSIYKKYGEFKIIKHYSQESLCYLLEMCFAKKALIDKITY